MSEECLMIKPGKVAGTRDDGPGMTQAETEDVLAQIAVLQGKVAALADRFRSLRQSARIAAAGDDTEPRPREGRPVVTGVPGGGVTAAGLN